MEVRYGHEASLRSVVLRAIDAMGPETREGLATRLILRLMMADVLPGEIGRLVEPDFELPGSAALRLAPDLKNPALVRQPPQPVYPRSRKPEGDRHVRLAGQGAKDARNFFQGGGVNKGQLFTRHATPSPRPSASR